MQVLNSSDTAPQWTALCCNCANSKCRASDGGGTVLYCGVVAYLQHQFAADLIARVVVCKVSNVRRGLYNTAAATRVRYLH